MALIKPRIELSAHETHDIGFRLLALARTMLKKCKRWEALSFKQYQEMGRHAAAEITDALVDTFLKAHEQENYDA